MASIIITEGKISKPEDIANDQNGGKEKFASGMEYFGKYFADNWNENDKGNSVYKVFEHIDSNTEYNMYKIHVNRKGKRVLREIFNPKLETDKNRINFKFMGNDGNLKIFRLNLRRDKAKAMNLSLPDSDDVRDYLSNVGDIACNKLSGDDRAEFLLANVLISRCK